MKYGVAVEHAAAGVHVGDGALLLDDVVDQAELASFGLMREDRDHETEAVGDDHDTVEHDHDCRCCSDASGVDSLKLRVQPHCYCHPRGGRDFADLGENAVETGVVEELLDIEVQAEPAAEQGVWGPVDKTPAVVHPGVGSIFVAGYAGTPVQPEQPVEAVVADA